LEIEDSKVDIPLIVPQACKPAQLVQTCIPKNRQVAAFQLEPKLDGFRMLAQINRYPAYPRIYSRTHKLQTGKLPHLDDELPRIFPPDTVVDGEIVALVRQGNGEGIENNFDFVQGVLNSLPDRARYLQEVQRPLDFYLFDILFLEGQNVQTQPLAHRRKLLYELYKEAHQEGVTKYVRLVPTLPATQESHDKLVTQGYEGSVIKDRARPYVAGKRGYGWYKIKKNPTVDVIILGFDDAVPGKFFDTFGAVRFGQYQTQRRGSQSDSNKVTEKTVLVERGACSGMDDSTRKWMHENRERLVGTVMEIAHFGVYPGSNHFRHPQFRRLRPDKNPEEVTYHNE
jgi:ATP-dependent DNA ligase